MTNVLHGIHARRKERKRFALTNGQVAEVDDANMDDVEMGEVCAMDVNEVFDKCTEAGMQYATFLKSLEPVVETLDADQQPELDDD